MITGVGAVVNTAAIPPGATVAVLGLGGVGLNAMMAATLSGAEQVIAVDVQGDKLAFARQLGATDTVNASDPDAVEQVGINQGRRRLCRRACRRACRLEAGYAMCRRGGTVVTAGLPRPEATLDVPIAQLVSDNRTIKGSYMGSCVPATTSRVFSRSIAGEITGRPAAQRLCRFRGLNAGFDRLAAGDAVRQYCDPTAPKSKERPMDENYAADQGVFNAGAEFQRRERKSRLRHRGGSRYSDFCPHRRPGCRRRSAGTTAAVAAARLGANVILAERYNPLGPSTGGLVIWIDRMTDWQGDLVIRGMGEELLDRLPDDAIFDLKSGLGLTTKCSPTNGHAGTAHFTARSPGRR